MSDIKPKYRKLKRFFEQYLYTRMENGALKPNLFYKLIKVAIIYIIAKMIKKLIIELIDRSLDKHTKKSSKYVEVSNERIITIGNILKTLVKWFIYFIAGMSALEVFDFETKSITTALLGSAGIVGLGLSLGAQSLIKDIINGAFILLEGQYSVGDHVEIEGKEGNVEELGLRVTKIRDFSGELHIIPNSKISIVTNKSSGPMRALVIASIAYEEDIEKSIRVLEDMCEEIKKEDIPGVIDGPNVLGVTELAEYSIDIRIVAMCEAGEHWAFERLLRERIKNTLDENNIEIPYAKIVTLKGE